MAISTFYPDAGSGGTTTDADIRRALSDPGESFSTIRDGAGTDAGSATAAFMNVWLESSNSTDNFQALYSAFMTFDTSSIGGDTVVSGTMSVYGAGLYEAALGTAADFDFGGGTMVDDGTAAAGDFVNRGHTSFGSFTGASFTSSDYNDATLNASGLAYINASGVTVFTGQIEWDIENSFGGTWVDSVGMRYLIESADQTGTTKDPKLVITHTAPGWSGGTLNSVDSSNIASVNGVATANISTINTV